MKIRIILTSGLAVLALVLGAGLFRSVAQRKMEPYAGRNGWTMEQEQFFIAPDGAKKKVAMVVTAYGEDGSFRKRTTRLKDDGSPGCTQLLLFAPGLGTFASLQSEKRLLLLSPTPTRPRGDLPVDAFAKEEGYLGDEDILGYRCAHSLTRTNGTIHELWSAYNLGGEALRTIIRDSEGTNVWETRDIIIGKPPASLLRYNKDWPIDYSSFEQQIQKMDGVRADIATQMRKDMNQLKTLVASEETDKNKNQ